MWKVYSCQDTETAVIKLTQLLTNVLGNLAPLKTFQVRKHYCPWLTNETKLLINERNKAQRKAILSKNNADWKSYKTLRNRVNSRIKAEKYDWHRKKFSESSRTTWANVKGWLGWNCGGPPKQLFDGAKLCSKPSELSSIMNSHFINKGVKIRDELPHSSGDPLKLARKQMENKICKFNLQPVHPDNVLEIISSLKNTKSCGIDNIDSYILKLAKYELVPSITHIVNLSITQGHFPQQWKLAKIVALHKKQNRCLPENYRPVALLCVLSKILEKAVSQQVIDYMENNSIFHPSHHGFRGQHSTCTALLEMHDGWLNAMNRGEFVATVMLDLSAAFDVVDHDLLLQKLNVYGFDKNSLQWIQSYLVGRYQVVLVDGYMSHPLPLNARVPQGSILGPLLYNLFTNDLPTVVQESVDERGSIVCYADDSTLSVSNKDPTILSQLLSALYARISNYMAINLLKLNSAKTHLLSFGKNSAGTMGIELNTGHEIIKPSVYEKLLGVYVSQDLKWDNQLRLNEKSMLKALTSRVNALWKISTFANFKTRKMIADGIFISTLVYMIQLWGGSSQSLISCLQIIQNKAARAVTKLGMRTPVKVLLLQCG